MPIPTAKSSVTPQYIHRIRLINTIPAKAMFRVSRIYQPD